MTLWCVKGGSYGEREQRILDNSVIGIGWEDLKDLSKLKNKEELEELYKETYPGSNKYRAGNHVGQLWAFAKEMKKGDLVVVPLKTQSLIAIGKITSDYVYESKYGEDMKHMRKVDWIKEDIPRTNFEQDLLYSFGAFKTVCQITRNNAEDRVKAILGGKRLTVQEEVAEESERDFDIQTIAKDQIRTYINRNFKGHELARLVEAVLLAQNYFTKRMEAGPDGGVDILAGSGSMGFDEPKLCVQVKSSDSAVDIEVLRSLKATMGDFKAKQGLLVSWGGFKKSVRKDSNNSFFSIRLWDSGELINQIEKNYDKLPESIQTEIPLERIWILTEKEDEE